VKHNILFFYLKGVPIRIEIGPRDMEKSQFVAVKRHNGEKVTGTKTNVETQIKTMLDEIQNAMFAK
jgi:prolyl-tRNA synthetase